MTNTGSLHIKQFPSCGVSQNDFYIKQLNRALASLLTAIEDGLQQQK